MAVGTVANNLMMLHGEIACFAFSAREQAARIKNFDYIHLVSYGFKHLQIAEGRGPHPVERVRNIYQATLLAYRFNRVRHR
jgi:hypothetical protein